MDTPGPESGRASQAQRPSLEDLVFEGLERLEQGGSQAFERLCLEHPEHATALRARLDNLRASGLVSADEAPEQFPERLGEFRLLRRLGHGGMGVVFVARQETLGRDVALKLIRPEQLFFRGARERFRREVEAVSRLSHPGIVPVHTVGEAEGVPYFAMELVAGASLDEILRVQRRREAQPRSGRQLLEIASDLARERGIEHGATGLPPAFAGPWRDACLWIARELAQALEHAHQRGVLHRDVKPSNVMLTPDGRILLVDFGLASAEGAGQITRAGSQAGSLPYMAPEQVRGETQRVDARTDVYGVGVTLYELLSLTAPFHGSNSAELSRAILEARPQPLRSRVPGLGGEIETVAATAMAPERERRYASAADLARDLTNLLERRPIAARPASARVRLARWTQRHPARAVAAALGALIVVGGPIVYGVQARNAARAQLELIDQLKVERDEARAQSTRADENFATALAAVDSLLSSIGDERLANVPNASAVRQELLEKALTFYVDFLAAHPDDPRLASDVLRARLRSGRLQRLLGRFDEAETSFAIVLDELRGSGPAALLPESDTLFAEAALDLGRILVDTDRGAEAEAVCDEALARGDVDPDLHFDLRGLLARILEVTGRGSSAEDELLELAGELEDLQGLGEFGPRRERLLGRSWAQLGSLQLAAGRRSEAKESFLRALEVLEPLALADPQDVSLQADLARLHTRLASSGWDESDEWQDAHALAAVRALELLAQGFGDWPQMASNLAEALSALGFQRFERGDAQGALVPDRRAAELFDQLVAAHPEVAEYRLGRARAQSNLYAVYDGLGRHHEALQCLDVAEAEVARCVEGQGTRPELLETWTVLRVNRGYALLSLGRYREAVDSITPLPDWPGWRESMSAAVVCVRALELLAADEHVGAAEAGALEERFTSRALELIGRGVDLGFDDLEDLRAGPNWPALRSLPGFQDIVARLAAKGADQ
jgi:serine/threonine protein kinase